MGGGSRWFASDNNAGAHPKVMEALAEANAGHAVGYGDDPLTAKAEAALASMFGKGWTVKFAISGTGANVYAIGCFVGHGDAVLCSECAHILIDEAGAPGSVTGAQMVPLRSENGKILPEALSEALVHRDDIHRPRPALLSISQPTELGTVYSLSELEALYGIAKTAGLVVHVDGARLSNAAVFLGTGPAEASGARLPQGADVVCFGGTKNGLLYGEAVAFAPRPDGRMPDIVRLRKTRLQLASKMRFISAQFIAYVSGGLWRECASSSNAMASRLARGLVERGLEPEYPVDTNGVFVKLPASAVEKLRAKRFFYDWEGGTVRWMASWDTTEADVDGMLADLDAELASISGKPAERASSGGTMVAAEARDPSPRGLGPAEAVQLYGPSLSAALSAGRAIIKSDWSSLDMTATPQAKGLPRPAFVGPVPDGAASIELPDPMASGLEGKGFAELTGSRRSRRRYKPEPISLPELSFLLWACAGVRKVAPDYTLRTVPSGGARHPLDTIVYARRVEGLEPGIYRFMAPDRKLSLLRPAHPVTGADSSKNGWLDLDSELDASLMGQLWNCAALFVWTALPYRTEWRYTAAAAKVVLLDAGHACQALYGACEALGLGTCAEGAYDQSMLDAALGVDGVEEFAVYAAPVGRV